MLRSTLRLFQAASTSSVISPIARTKLTTSITGLEVHSNPIPSLISVYNSTLSLLEQIPPSAVYRQSVESITKERLSILNELKGQGSEHDIELIEGKIGNGLIEEVLIMAEGELKLAGKMLEWQPWSELEEAPVVGQWEPFRVTASTTSADDLPK